MKTAILTCLCGLALAAPAFAQSQLPLGTHVGNSVPGGYDDGNRRDPFVSLMTPKKAGAAAAARGKAGLGAVAVADVSVKGIVHNGTGIVAVLESPDGRSYIARSKDKLQDAVVKSIDSDGVVFVEQEVDAAGVMRARDVRKTLRPANAEGVR